MALEKFGKKRICDECQIKFYDFNKSSDLKCPRCGKEYNLIDNLNINELNRLYKEKNNEKLKDNISHDGDISNMDDSDAELPEENDMNNEVISIEEIEDKDQ